MHELDSEQRGVVESFQQVANVLPMLGFEPDARLVPARALVEVPEVPSLEWVGLARDLSGAWEQVITALEAREFNTPGEDSPKVAVPRWASSAWQELLILMLRRVRQVEDPVAIRPVLAGLAESGLVPFACGDGVPRLFAASLRTGGFAVVLHALSGPMTAFLGDAEWSPAFPAQAAMAAAFSALASGDIADAKAAQAPGTRIAARLADPVWDHLCQDGFVDAAGATPRLFYAAARMMVIHQFGGTIRLAYLEGVRASLALSIAGLDACKATGDQEYAERLENLASNALRFIRGNAGDEICRQHVAEARDCGARRSLRLQE